MDSEDLVQIHLIEQLKYRYLRGLDQKDWDLVAACFTEDATASYGGGAWACGSRDEIMAFLLDALGSTAMLTSHQVSQPEIELRGPDEAVGTWALNDIVIHQEHDITISGAAFYQDRYVRVDGRWLIAATGYLRTYEELHPRGSVEGLTLTADRWATAGRSLLGPSPEPA